MLICHHQAFKEKSPFIMHTFYKISLGDGGIEDFIENHKKLQTKCERKKKGKVFFAKKHKTTVENQGRKGGGRLHTVKFENSKK